MYSVSLTVTVPADIFRDHPKFISQRGQADFNGVITFLLMMLTGSIVFIEGFNGVKTLSEYFGQYPRFYSVEQRGRMFF